MFADRFGFIGIDVIGNELAIVGAAGDIVVGKRGVGLVCGDKCLVHGKSGQRTFSNDDCDSGWRNVL